MTVVPPDSGTGADPGGAGTTPGGPGTAPGGWLASNRLTIALAVAGVESVVVAVDETFSRWFVLGLAAIAVWLYFAKGRTSDSDDVRQLTWIAAVSQSLALLAVVLAASLKWIALGAAGVFAVVALVLLLRREKP
jgi:FtsH-binding integral membrane protein